MKKRFKNMDEVYKAAEKTAQEQAFHRADTKDSEERLADYTIASAHEDKFNESVDGHQAEAEWAKEEDNDSKKQTEEELDEQRRNGISAKDIVHGAYNSITAFGTSAAISLVSNDALNRTGIPNAFTQGINAVTYEVGKNIFKDKTDNRVMNTMKKQKMNDERGR